MSDYNQKKLHKRAAEYYRLVRDVQTPTSIKDLEPQLLEFDHLILSNDFDEATNVMNEIGVDLALWGFLDRVVDMRSKLLTKIKNQSLEVDNMFHIADAYRMMGKSQKALEFATQALRLAKNINDEILISKVSSLLGGVFRRLGQYSDAIENLQIALLLAKKHSNTSVQLQASIQLGQILYYINKVDDSEKTFSDALHLAEREHDLRMAGDLQGQLGYTALWKNNIQESIVYFSKALNIAREVNNKRGQGYWYLGSGEGHLVGRQYEEAEINFLAAIRIAEEISDDHLKSYAGSFLAQSQLHKGELEKATISIENARKLDNPQHNDFMAMLQGLILARLNKNHEANIVLEQALNLGESILNKNPDLLEARWSQGIVFTLLSIIKSNDEIRESFLQSAKNSFDIVQRNTKARGVTSRFLDILNEVRALDKDNIFDSLNNVINN